MHSFHHAGMERPTPRFQWTLEAFSSMVPCEVGSAEKHQ